MRKLFLLSAAAACFTLAAVLFLQGGLPERAAYTGLVLDSGQIAAPELDFLAPSFAGDTLTGLALTLEDLRGNPVVVNFWATWCVPCRVEMPELQRLHEQFPDVTILGVNLAEQPGVVQRWVDEFGLTFPIVLDREAIIATRYQVRVQPSTFVISPEGIISRIYYGPVTAQQLDSVLSEYGS